jgi:biotin synthase
MTAFARIALPRAKVRFSAGRTRLSDETQTLCFYAGGNSIFYGDKLLTAANCFVPMTFEVHPRPAASYA